MSLRVLSVQSYSSDLTLPARSPAHTPNLHQETLIDTIPPRWNLIRAEPEEQQALMDFWVNVLLEATGCAPRDAGDCSRSRLTSAGG